MKKKHDQANPPTPPKPTDRAYINEPKGYLSTPIWGIGPNQKNQKEKKKKNSTRPTAHVEEGAISHRNLGTRFLYAYAQKNKECVCVCMGW